ncbi:hypothetical protein [Rhizobium aouanii]|uniref:Winged helix-turn-helix transcriptional regulator n=1 Tax=Rhizobium aouanii TaxID=3118145 RepID=A0ABU8CG35_9HYPH
MTGQQPDGGLHQQDRYQCRRERPPRDSQCPQRDYCPQKAETIAKRIGLSVSAVQTRLKSLREEAGIRAEVPVGDREATGRAKVLTAG